MRGPWRPVMCRVRTGSGRSLGGSGRNYSHVAIAALLVNILGLAAPLFIMSVYDRVIPNGAIPSLVALSIGMVLAISFEFVLRMVRSRIIDMTGKTNRCGACGKSFRARARRQDGATPAFGWSPRQPECGNSTRCANSSRQAASYRRRISSSRSFSSVFCSLSRAPWR